MFGMDYSSLVLCRVGNEFQLQQITCKNADKGKPENIKVIATFKPSSADKVNYQPALHRQMYLQLKVQYIGGKTKEGTNKHEAHVTFAYSEDGKEVQALRRYVYNASGQMGRCQSGTRGC